MGTVCGDLLSPCVCSIGRVARTRAARRLRFRGRGCIRAKRCIGIPCACLCSCPTQSASALGASISTLAEMTTAGEGNSVDPDGGRPLRKVVRRSLFAEWVPSAARISSDSAQQGGAELSDAAAVTDSVVQPQPTADRGAECSREQSLVRAAPGGGRTSRASSSRSVRADLAAADVCSSNFTHGTRRTIPTLSIPMQRPPVHGVVLWFQVADFDAAMDRVRELAAVIIYGPLGNPALRHREVWLRDPDH